MPSLSRLILGASVLTAMLASSSPLSAQIADDIIAHYIKTVGGMNKIEAVKTLRRTGKFNGSGGFEAIIVQENKRPNLVREEFTLQGMTAINAWDGQTGWKIDPFGGKKDAEALSEDEMRSIVEDADFDEPLVNYKEKGNRVEYVGMDQIEGTDVYKLKVTLKSGDVRTYYLDTDSYAPIKMDETRTIRGSEQQLETTLGDYKQVDGWYLPFSIESGTKGQTDKGKVTWDKIDANVTLDDARFHKPVVGAAPAAEPAKSDALDASNKQPKTQPKSGTIPPTPPPPPPPSPKKKENR